MRGVYRVWGQLKNIGFGSPEIGHLKRDPGGAGEITSRLGALAVLPEDLDWISRTHMEKNICNSTSRGSDALFWTQMVHTRASQTYTLEKHPHT